mgnify:CR=1 FL=1
MAAEIPTPMPLTRNYSTGGVPEYIISIELPIEEDHILYSKYGYSVLDNTPNTNIVVGKYNSTTHEIIINGDAPLRHFIKGDEINIYQDGEFVQVENNLSSRLIGKEVVKKTMINHHGQPYVLHTEYTIIEMADGTLSLAEPN